MLLDGSQARTILSLCIFTLTTAALSARYSFSAAFERPIHLSILTLFLIGTSLSYGARWLHTDASAIRFGATMKYDGFPFHRQLLADRPLARLIAAVVVRVLVSWHVNHTIQCSWEGRPAILPLVLALVDIRSPWSIINRVVTSSDSDTSKAWPTIFQRWQHSLVLVVWAVANMGIYNDLSLSVERVCPATLRWQFLVPFAQLVVVAADAAVITLTTSILADSDEGNGPMKTLALASWTSAGALAVAAALACIDAGIRDGALSLPNIASRDLLFDSLLASATLLSAGYALLTYRADILLLSAGVCMVLTYQVAHLLGDGLANPMMMVMAFLALGQIILQERALAQDDHGHKRLLVAYFYVAIALLVAWVLLPSPFLGEDKLLREILAAHGSSDAWIYEATQSTSLTHSVDVYKTRYGIPPPPNFDKWYNFAMALNTTVIDAFDQIFEDLRPFWGLSPAIIRSQTAHLLAHPSLSIAGLHVRQGDVQISDHVPGTHMWMMEANANMIRPFAQWLPDMDIPFNLDDECRVAVPFADLSALNIAGNSARAFLVDSLESAEGVLLRTEFDAHAASRWRQEVARREGIMSPFFSDYTKHNIFHDLVAPTCPPASPARSWTWWDRKNICASCIRESTTSSADVRAVVDWKQASDLCMQPDLRHLSGFLSAPAPLVATTQPFPIFSQSKVTGFTDILVPSPWHYADKAHYTPDEDMAWEQKADAVFWRGSPTDGHAQRGEWTGYLRARFVDSAQHLVARNDSTAYPFGVNVTFVGPFHKCEGPGSGKDCADEIATFYHENKYTPEPVPFATHWSYRHLIDLDGAGFSGRFLPFLRSNSLPYRAAVFRSWIDERVHAWRHFVPLDIRLGQKGLWGVVKMFASGGASEQMGRQIAAEGRTWAEKVLRKEDMQVYMFRLLLEWARLVDENRETLGFG